MRWYEIRTINRMQPLHEVDSLYLGLPLTVAESIFEETTCLTAAELEDYYPKARADVGLAVLLGQLHRGVCTRQSYMTFIP